MRIFNLQLWQNFFDITGSYWYVNDEQKRSFSEVLWSWGILGLLLFLLVSINSVNAYISYVNRDLIYILEQKDAPSFFRTLFIYAGTFVVLTPLIVFSQNLRKQLSLDWYKWLTNNILDKYFHNRAYYKINFDSQIKNPDQSISQEIEPIPSTALDFVFIILEKSLEMVAFILILWSISKPVAAFLVIYAIIGNLIIINISQQLDKVNSNKLASKGDFRYYLTHVRDNAESIAFFQGEVQELNLIKQKFAEVIDNSAQILGRELNMQLITTGYQFFLLIYPFLTVAPLFFKGEIELGEVSQASIACTQFAGGLALIVYQIGTLSSFNNLVSRLVTFSDALEQTQNQQENITIQTVEEDRFVIEQATLQTPNYEQVLIQDLSLSVEPGTGLLVVGPSGCGKSSLLRAIAGLWNTGTGRLVRPNLKEILFLPQRPYMILGSLRQQLLYPNNNNQVGDRELEIILQQVNLGDLLTRVGGFDAEVYWEKILSLGEQQRLAFARLLVTRPRYVILDEATSALDFRNEENLYRQLQEIGATFISVGHRESLLNYHQSVLQLSKEDSTWRLVPSQGYQSNFQWE